jgi:hypothetical protein
MLRRSLEVKLRQGTLRYMLIKSSKDLSGTFIIGAINRLLTVGTVENQHFEFSE